MDGDKFANEVMDRLRKRLKEAREFAGLSLRQAAERLEISHSTLNAIENGSQELTLFYLMVLAHIYGEPAWQLLQQEWLAVTVANRLEAQPKSKGKGKRKVRIDDGQVVG